MLKPSGLLQYGIVALAGAGGAVTKNIISDNDQNGNRIDVSKLPDSSEIVGLLEVIFSPTTLAAGGNAGLCTVGMGVTVVNGVVTNVDATLTNNSAGAGDTVTGILYVRLNHRENLAI